MTDVFVKSPIMPTYLVAFAVFEFSNAEASEDGRVRLWARDEIAEHTNYALSVAPPLLRQMETYTNIPYLLPKMDLVAVPKMDFPAMENWGMLTFRYRMRSLIDGIARFGKKKK